MATFRGIDGAVHLGGVISTGSPQLKGGVSGGATAATLDGGGSALEGVVVPGDEFTVAGDGTTYTIVTGGAIGASTANEVAITFTPGVQVGSWSDNAAATFTNNQVVEVTEWSAEIDRDMIERSVLGDEGKRYEAEQIAFTGSITAWFDYDDAEQAEFFDAINGDDPSTAGVTLVSETDKQTIYGEIRPRSLGSSAQKGALINATFGFNGQGVPAINWN